MQVNQSSTFQVGGTPLDRARQNPETFAKLAEAAAGVPIEENKPAGDWKKIADRITKNDEVSTDDLNAFKELSKAAGPERKRLRSELAASGFKNEELKAQLSNFYVFDGPYNKLTEQLRVAQAKVAVEALVGAGFGPLNVVIGYHAYANLQKGQLQDLVAGIENVEKGTAQNYFPGNRVQQVHREQVWQTMNHMLDDGITAAKQGKPQEVNAQYYELTNPAFVGKLADNAAAGNKVRCNIDAGRLVAFKGNEVGVNELLDKSRVILQLTSAPGDIGVSVYPVAEKLGDPGDLMHRKGLRVGEKFLLSGMNANSGSGENIDAGYIIEGPAARQLSVNFKRDVDQSTDASNEAIFGAKALSGWSGKTAKLGMRGLMAFLDCSQGGPSPIGVTVPRPKDFAGLDSYAKSKGQSLEALIDPGDQGTVQAAVERMLKDPEVELKLTPEGQQAALGLATRAMDATRTPKNIKSLGDIAPVKGDPQGNAVVSIADIPTERETELIMAIQNAEKFVYMPAFVITKPVAAALVAKKQDMEAAGKPFDVKVIADPGIYPDGGTPNEAGVRMLEDGGIRARWALLPRCGDHDRKIHAKELLTDNSEFFGSTNFSKKGLQENHEHSGVVHFDAKDSNSMHQRSEAMAHFQDLWDNFSYECNSVDLASLWKKNYQGKDKEFQIEDSRGGVVRKVLRGVEAWEKESGTWTQQQAQSPAVQQRIAELQLAGMDEMSAMHVAVRKEMGDSAYFAGLHSLPGYRDLQKMAPHSSSTNNGAPRSNGGWDNRRA